tara:strand:+ start:771 stop:1448 length:678 start_codon:yes stop_codon:yes gene_type:complete
MKSQFSLIIDFDSTIIGVETLECLAEIVLSDKQNKKQIINKISNYTDLAMSGQIPFEKSLEYRFELMNVNKSHIKNLINKLSKEFDNSFFDNLNFFKKNSSNIYIVSGGFQNIIESVMFSSTNFQWNVFANELIFNKEDRLVGVNLDNPLASSLGKVNLIKSLNLKTDIIVVGDGYTDYEIKKHNLAKYFLAYTKYVKRDNVIPNADKICTNFDQVVKFIEQNYY